MGEIKVNFYDSAPDACFKYAVIVSRCNGKWVWCKHKERDTYEIPGGHREAGEAITDTAKRELYEETGAKDFTIHPVCVYAVDSGKETFGMLYYAEIIAFEESLHSEIERIDFFNDVPEKLTYPLIQPFLFEKVQSYLEGK